MLSRKQLSGSSTRKRKRNGDRLTESLRQLNGLVSFFQKYKDDGFATTKLNAQEIATNMNIEPIFCEKRYILISKQFDENPYTAREKQSSEDSFRTNYFYVIVDMAISQLNNRLEQLKSFQSIFGFLFDAAKLVSLDDCELKNSCLNLQKTLTVDDKYDISASCLCSELQVLQLMLPTKSYETDKSWTSMKILKFAKEMDMFPNVMLAYKLLLTLPITVAYVERSFSKLKLIKNYLRTTMSQDRLNELAIMYIENDIFKHIDYNNIIDDFVSKNARRSHFK